MHKCTETMSNRTFIYQRHKQDILIKRVHLWRHSSTRSTSIELLYMIHFSFNHVITITFTAQVWRLTGGVVSGTSVFRPLQQATFKVSKQSQTPIKPRSSTQITKNDPNDGDQTLAAGLMPFIIPIILLLGVLRKSEIQYYHLATVHTHGFCLQGGSSFLTFTSTLTEPRWRHRHWVLNT